MLVETKAKVGVFSIALGAYLPQFPQLVSEFEEQYDNFKKTLPKHQIIRIQMFQNGWENYMLVELLVRLLQI